jgi:prevent-host-death family protein
MPRPDATHSSGNTVELRELQQDAPELVRQVAAGQKISITVAGQTVARLIPAAARAWRQWDDIAEVFTATNDPEWTTDRDAIPHTLQGRWAQP